MKILSILVLAVWCTAVLRTILNLWFVRPLARRMPARTPLVSVIIPARDEERSIERTVRAFLAQTYPALEVIVVDDRSTDRTGEILARMAAEDARLVVVRGEEPPPGWLGKPAALHRGSARASGELLLFVDADVVYAPDAVAAAVAYLEESGAAMLSLLPNVEMHGFWENVAMPQLAVTAFSVLPLWLANRTTIPILGAGGGPGNLIRREIYDRVGGHEALRDAVVDDIALSRLVRRGGFPTQLVRAEHLVTLRMYHGRREIVSGFTKNAFAVFGYSFVAFAIVTLLTLVVHLLPYLLALSGDRIAWITLAMIALSRVILFAALRYRLDNALFGHLPMMGIWGWILLRSMWLTGVRRQLQWRGRTYDASQTRFGADGSTRPKP